MGNISSQNETSKEGEQSNMNDKNIIFGFIIIIIIFMLCHGISTYSKCNNNLYRYNYNNSLPIVYRYGEYINNGECYNNRQNPNMFRHDTSKIRYNIRTSEGGNLLEHLDNKCKSSYTNEEINCVQAYVSKQKLGGSALATKYDNDYSNQTLLDQANYPMSASTQWSSSNDSPQYDDVRNIDGQSYYGSSDRGIRVNNNSGNNTSFDNSPDYYNPQLNIDVGKPEQFKPDNDNSDLYGKFSFMNKYAYPRGKINNLLKYINKKK